MSRSYTYNVIGYSAKREVIEDGQKIIRRTAEGAMSRLEVMQLAAYAKKVGRPIIEWQAQTKTGQRVLGNEWSGVFPIKTENVPKVKVVECPKCQGTGKGCSICNFSGFTTRKHLKGFRAWQLQPDK